MSTKPQPQTQSTRKIQVPVSTDRDDYFLWERLVGILEYGINEFLIDESSVKGFFEKFGGLNDQQKEAFLSTLDDKITNNLSVIGIANNVLDLQRIESKIEEIKNQLRPEVRPLFEYVAYSYINGQDIDQETKELIDLIVKSESISSQVDNIEALQQRVYNIQKTPLRVDQLNSQTRGQAVSRENIQALLDLADGNENAQTNPTAQDFGIQNPGTNQIYNQGPQGSPSRSQTSTTNNTPPPRPSTPNPRANQVNNPKPSNSRSKLQNLQQKPSRTNSAFSVPNQNRPNPGNQRPTPVQPPRPQQSNPNYQTGGNRPGVAKTFTFGTAHQNPQNHQNPRVRPPAPNPRQNQSRPAPQQPSNGANPQTPPPGDPTKSVFNQSVKKRNGGLDDLLG
jgi:hypothetical protein